MKAGAAWRSAGLLLAGLLLLAPARAAQTVILARHAEQAAAPAADPPLTAAGRRRAEALAATLAPAGVTSIYVTEYRRTQETAAPLASRLHLESRRIDAKKTADLVAAIRARKDRVVLVVAHGNTLPEIITALGGPVVKISDAEYDSLFILTISGNDVSLVRLHYGSASKPSTGKASKQPMLAPKK